MRLAQIQNEVVVNVLIADELFPSTPTDTYIESDTAGIGWVFENGELLPPVIDHIALAEAHIEKYFSAFGLMEGLKKMIHAETAGTLESIPKTVAVSAWVDEVKRLALEKETQFPPAPYTLEETLAENQIQSK
jgi:hypothetical protein